MNANVSAKQTSAEPLDENNENVQTNSTMHKENMEEENVNFIMRLAHRAFPDGGILSGIFNLAGGSIGAGILGLPAAFHMSGIVVGTLELIAIYLLTVLSMDLLARAAAKTGIRSFEEMGRLDVTSTCWDLLKT